jgi:sugar phosphate isomerase/epimerase
MRLGISSYTFPWAVGVPGYPPSPRPLTAEGLLARAVELGVRLVQIADNLPLDALGGAELDALARYAGEHAIDLQIGTRGVEPDHLRRYLRLAVRFRSPLVRVVLDTAARHPTPEEAEHLLKEVLPDYERAGVCLAVENHDRFKAAVLATLLDRLDSRHVGVCLDTANSIAGLEDVATLLRALGPRVVNLHVKDFHVRRLPHQMGFVVEGRPAGRGQLDVPGLLAGLRAHGRDPDAILELWPPPGDTVAESVAREAAWAAESVAYLRRFIGGVNS